MFHFDQNRTFEGILEVADDSVYAVIIVILMMTLTLLCLVVLTMHKVWQDA